MRRRKLRPIDSLIDDASKATDQAIEAKIERDKIKLPLITGGDSLDNLLNDMLTEQAKLHEIAE